MKTSRRYRAFRSTLDMGLYLHKIYLINLSRLEHPERQMIVVLRHAVTLQRKLGYV